MFVEHWTEFLGGGHCAAPNPARVPSRSKHASETESRRASATSYCQRSCKRSLTRGADGGRKGDGRRGEAIDVLHTKSSEKAPVKYSSRNIPTRRVIRALIARCPPANSPYRLRTTPTRCAFRWDTVKIIMYIARLFCLCSVCRWCLFIRRKFCLLSRKIFLFSQSVWAGRDWGEKSLGKFLEIIWGLLLFYRLWRVIFSVWVSF